MHNRGSVEYQHLHSDSGGLPEGRYHDVKLECVSVQCANCIQRTSCTKMCYIYIVRSRYLPDGQSFGPWPNGNRRRVALDAPELPHCRYEVVNGRDLPAREHMVTVNCE